MIYGYVRVSTQGQRDGNSIEDQQQAILMQYPGAEIITEVFSGAKERPQFTALLDTLQIGDTLVVTKLDRFCRSTKEGLGYIDMALGKGARIHILNMGLIEDTINGRLLITMLLAFAEFERSMIKERTMAGKAVARTKPGYKEGRPRKEIANLDHYREAVERKEMTATQAAAELGISRSQWYNLLKQA